MLRVLLAAIGVATALQAGIALNSVAMTPAGSTWLGNSRMHPGDTAVYVSYLRQAQSGRFALDNLYATEPHARRFDPFWSTAGRLMPQGTDPRIWLFALRLATVAFLISAIAWSCSKTFGPERGARGFILVLAGLGGGWAYAAFHGALGMNPIASIGPPDIETMFSAFPALFEAPHYAFSLALQTFGAVGTWRWIQSRGRADGLIGLGSFTALLSFHPYFSPWYAAFAGIGLLNRARKPKFQDALLIFPALPLAAIYLPLLLDPVFRIHHTQDNQLPFAPISAWIMTSAPFVIAAAWRIWKRAPVMEAERWALAWATASAFCLFIPVPWKRQFTQGLGPALTLAAFPALDAAWSWTQSQTKTFSGSLMAATLGFGLFLNPLSALASQAIAVSMPTLRPFFYTRNGAIDGWHALERLTGPETTAITDDAWANLWTPALALRRVWTGHDHETPEFSRKQKAWKNARDAGTDSFLAWASTSDIPSVFLTGHLPCPDKDPEGWRTAWRKDSLCILIQD